MTNKGMASYQLLGDIVNSRAVDDRSRLHRDVVGALGAVNAQVSGIDGLDVTVGDEFQGRYRTLGAALGCGLGGFVLLPKIGFEGTARAGAIVALSAALSAALYFRPDHRAKRRASSHVAG